MAIDDVSVADCCTGRCEACGLDIVNVSEACQAMGRLYHTNCFLCSLCRMFSPLSLSLCHHVNSAWCSFC